MLGSGLVVLHASVSAPLSCRQGLPSFSLDESENLVQHQGMPAVLTVLFYFPTDESAAGHGILSETVNASRRTGALPRESPQQVVSIQRETPDCAESQRQ
jgi:hypothetical protein